MPRRRKKDKHLPERVYWKNGAYRMLTKNGKWVRLGKTLSEMYSSLSEFHKEPDNIITFNQLMDRYIKEIAPDKSKKSYLNNIQQAKFLKQSFGYMKPCEITSVDIYKYLDIRGQKGRVAANREVILLSHLFNYAIRWGLVTFNPCTNVKKFSENKRSRNITQGEFDAVLSIANYPINYAMQLTYLMGLRPTETLNLKKSNILEEGFLIEITKTKFSVSKKLVEWSPALRKVVFELLERNKHQPSNIDHLLVNNNGQPYTYTGFSCLWQRTVKRAMKKNVITNTFQFRDIRHKAATDIERTHGREAARQLLGHTTQNTTARYIDGVSIVKGVLL